MLLADRLRGPQALVGVRGRHADVDDRDVGVLLADRGEELRGIAGLGNDLESGLGEQAGHAFPHEDRIVRDRDPERHGTGINARIAGPDSSSLGMNPRTRLASRRGP